MRPYRDAAQFIRISAGLLRNPGKSSHFAQPALARVQGTAHYWAQPGRSLCALAATDLLNVNPSLAPVVYTWAEPRVGHDDFVSFCNTRVNICYRIVNVWDVVPRLPPDIAAYEHQGNEVTIDSGFSLDVVHNHVLITGCTPGIAMWNRNRPPQVILHFGAIAVSAMVGQTT